MEVWRGRVERARKKSDAKEGEREMRKRGKGVASEREMERGKQERASEQARDVEREAIANERVGGDTYRR